MMKFIFNRRTNLIVALLALVAVLSLLLQQTHTQTNAFTTSTSRGTFYYNNVMLIGSSSLSTNTMTTTTTTTTLPFFTTTTTTTTGIKCSNTVLYMGKKAARAGGNARKSSMTAEERRANKKPKDDVIEVNGVVLESLPNAMFRVVIDGAPSTQEPVLATISGKIRKNFVKILVGDIVTMELSPYDLTRGRITFRMKK